MELVLRAIVDEDLPIFFEQQLDPEANWMAAFAAKDPTDHEAFLAHWSRIRTNAAITSRTILCDGQVAGNIACFPFEGLPTIGYWIGRAYWGQGVATKALATFVDELQIRPLHARVAKDNAASLRVLAKCGFTVYGEDKGFAEARGAETEEWLLRLGAPS